jgi:hypothetical protein
MARACGILAALTGCSHGAVPLRADSRATVAAPTAPLASREPPALTFSPWDGVYFRLPGGAPGSDSPALVRTLPHGVSIVVGHDGTTSTTATSGGGWAFQMTEGKETYALLLKRPEHEGLPWHLGVDGMNVDYEQRVGALEALVQSHLVVGERFVRLDRNKLGPAGPLEDALTGDAITIMEHGLVRTELPDGHGICTIDVLIPAFDPGNKPLPSPLPADGALGSVSYMMVKLDPGCRGRPLDGATRGLDGGLRFFADRTGSIVGVLSIGYMYSEIFVGPHVSRVDLERMGRAGQDELENQAE